MRYFISCKISVLAVIFLLAGTASAIYLPIKYKWDYPIPTDMFYFLDLNQNGQQDIYAVIFGQENYINVFNSSGDLQWSTSVSEMKRDAGCTPVGEDVYYIYVDDINNNKDLDIFVASKVRGEKVNLNPVAYFERETDPASETHKQVQRWKYDDFEGMVNDMTSADLNSDGKKELIAASSLGFVYVIGDQGTEVPQTITYLDNGTWKQRTTYALTVQVMDKYNLDGNSVNSVVASDIDRDGVPEIIAGTYRGIYLIDGGIKWSYPTETGIKKVAASNLYENGLIAATDGNILYALDSTGKLKWQKELGDIADLTIADLDNDSSVEIVTAEGDKIRAYSSTDGNLLWEYPQGDVIHKMVLLSDNELAINTKDRIYVLQTDDVYAKNLTAYKYLDMAKDYYLKGDCLSARDPAEKALEILTEINNTEGMLDAEIIQIQCKNDTTNKELADEYYATAQKYFQEADYEDARAYNDKAMQIYSDVGYTYGVTWLTGKLLEQIDDAEFKVKVDQADKLYAAAYWQYTIDDLHNATVTLDKAKSIYQDINYTQGLQNCDSLYNDIDTQEKMKTADELADLARTKYAELEYKDAINSIDQALQIYQEINATNETIEMTNLKNQSENYVQAEEYDALAQSSYNTGLYENATYYANQSKNIYADLEDYAKMAANDQIIADSQEKIKEKQMWDMVQLGGMIIAGIIAAIVALFVISRFMRKRT